MPSCDQQKGLLSPIKISRQLRNKQLYSCQEWMNGSQVSGSAGQGRDLIGGKSLAAEDRKVRITRVFDNRRTNTSADQDENDGGLRQGLTGSNPTVNRLVSL